MIRKTAPAFALAVAMGLATTGMAAASGVSDPVAEARSAAERLREATALLSEATRARDRIAALTETIRAYEDGLGALRDALREAAIRERAIRAEFDANSGQLSQVIGAMQTMGRSPETTLLLHPSGALSTARAGMLLEDVVPAMRQEVARLKADLDELAILGVLRANAVASLEAGLQEVQTARTELSQAMSNRTGLPPPLATDVAAIQALLNSADTLEGFASSLAAGGPGGAEGTASAFADARGQLPWPVDGRVSVGFNEADASGLSRPGLVVEAAAGALVTAPWTSTIRYAGPFLDYGNVIVLEPQDGYLLILAGLEEVFGQIGEVVASGDPLGLLGGQSPSQQQVLIELSGDNGQDKSETLYMELRTGDGPVNPADWFARRTE